MSSPPRPSVLHLGPHTVTINFAPKLRKRKGEVRRGESCRAGKTIDIRTKGQHRTAQASTLIHEILHQILWPGPLQEMAGWNEEVEEAICLALEAPLLEVFMKNPKVVAWLAAGGTYTDG